MTGHVQAGLVPAEARLDGAARDHVQDPGRVVGPRVKSQREPTSEPGVDLGEDRPVLGEERLDRERTGRAQVLADREHALDPPRQGGFVRQGDALHGLTPHGAQSPPRHVVDRHAVEIEERIDRDLRATQVFLDDRVLHHGEHVDEPIGPSLVGVDAGASPPWLDEQALRKSARHIHLRRQPCPGDRDAGCAEDPLRLELVQHHVDERCRRDEQGASARGEGIPLTCQRGQVRIDGRHDEPDVVGIDDRQQAGDVVGVARPWTAYRDITDQQRGGQRVDIGRHQPTAARVRGIHEGLDECCAPARGGHQDIRDAVVPPGGHVRFLLLQSGWRARFGQAPRTPSLASPAWRAQGVSGHDLVSKRTGSECTPSGWSRRRPCSLQAPEGRAPVHGRGGHHGLDVDEHAPGAEAIARGRSTSDRRYSSWATARIERIEVGQLLERSQLDAVLVQRLARRAERIVDQRLDAELPPAPGGCPARGCCGGRPRSP